MELPDKHSYHRYESVSLIGRNREIVANSSGPNFTRNRISVREYHADHTWRQESLRALRQCSGKLGINWMFHKGPTAGNPRLSVRSSTWAQTGVQIPAEFTSIWPRLETVSASSANCRSKMVRAARPSNWWVEVAEQYEENELRTALRSDIGVSPWLIIEETQH